MTAYCSMIHGGLTLDFISDKLHVGHCCLIKEGYPIDTDKDFWKDPVFDYLRNKNKRDEWDQRCNNCFLLEKNSMISMRQGMNAGLNIIPATDISGPARIDLKFDISCNLACRTCGPVNSTFWQHHLKQHNKWSQPIFSSRRKDQIINALSKLNLENLRQVVFSGGETLLGNEYWAVAEWLADNVPNAKDQLILAFQTNGTQPILDRYHAIIEKCHLIKLHVSLDAADRQFEYLRWPASWAQVTQNLIGLKETLPSNVMFLIETTVSVFNVLHLNAIDQWAKTVFSTNREGDPTDHTHHLAMGVFSLENCSADHVQLIKEKGLGNLVPSTWSENPKQIQQMVNEIKEFDKLRNEDFQLIFPETAQCYQRFL